VIVGVDVGSTTVKATVVDAQGAVCWQDYRRHDTKQAETVAAFLARIESECGFTAGRDRIFATGSGAGIVAPLVGARFVQEVVAVSAAVEVLHPHVRFVSEIGGEDMKTIFFTPAGDGRSKQVFMQSACSGGTGTFVEKTARKLHVDPDRLAACAYDGATLHKISSKCGIFAETDANTLVKGGVPVDEIIASLFEAVVYQNLATLTKGNTPQPEVLLLGGPNLFFTGLQQAWRFHLGRLWRERGIALPAGRDVASLVQVPAQALYYACLGCVEVARAEPLSNGVYVGRDKLAWWIEHGQWEAKAKEGSNGLVRDEADRAAFVARYGDAPRSTIASDRAARDHALADHATADRTAGLDADHGVVVGCDFGSTTAKAVVLAPSSRELLFSCYSASNGNPIEDAKALLRQIRAAGHTRVASLAITGYGKDLLNDIVGADLAIVETVAHATSALHVVPDADVICDVGGCDVKIMILRQGTVADFRLNSQCSSGNGAFLQGVAERYAVPLEQYAERAFQARAVPALAMGCGVFLQSDIVNQQRKGWSADEIMASLAAVLPLNVWVYAGQLQNLAAAGRRFVLQGGTHRNLAVVKAQVDFIRSKVPDAEIVVHPYSGEAGAIGAALCAADALEAAPAPRLSRFRGFDVIESLEHTSTTNDDTVCRWCPVNCKRSFIDVRLPGAAGRPWSKVPLEPGWERVISGNTCPKGLLEDANEMRVVKAKLDAAKDAHPNIADLVRDGAFKRAKALV
jgi:predicted CoA-substrate-specific enzyme activase